MTASLAALHHIAAAITHNTPIDRQRLAAETGLTGERLESWLCRAVCAFCLHSQGATGAFGKAGPGLKREEVRCP